MQTQGTRWEQVEPLSLPPPPTEAVRVPFPLVACLAPLAASGAIWALTRSPFALIFAVLSPIIAVASMVDNRWQSRRRTRKDAADRLVVLATLRTAVAARHDTERRERERRTASASVILSAPPGDVTRWRTNDDERVLITLGRGTIPSELRLAGSPAGDNERVVRDAAARLTDAPVVVDARHGVGIVGPKPLARALARGYLVQLTHRLSPASATLARIPAQGWQWARMLPYMRDAGSASTRAGGVILCVIETSRGVDGLNADGLNADGLGADGLGVAVTIALAERAEDLPVECRTVIRLDGLSSAEVVMHPDGPLIGPVQPEFVTAQQAAAHAAALAEHARSAGLGAGVRAIPDAVSLTQLSQTVRSSGSRTSRCRTTLTCPIGMDRHGIRNIDLVADGPHAVVGGTTGSGKSELLVTWVASLASRYRPEDVTFLLVDFKGGAAFAPLTPLPHCVGVVTDLDHGEAQRALDSLRAELRYRERVLAEAGIREITAAGATACSLSRLVIVVDEFAAMMETFPDLHALFVDVAARGRSLGVHLILCTQRPAGVVRDSLLANCNLRLSLRVNNRADSAAVVGSDAAALLPAAHPGRCVIGTDGDEPCTVQIASTSAADVERIAHFARRPGAPPSRRPWLEPLAGHIPLVQVAGAAGDCAPGEFMIGVQDVPSEQSQGPVGYRPVADGHLLAIGSHGSGKTMLLAVLEAQTAPACRVDRVPADLERSWDILMLAAARVRSPGAHLAPQLLVIDDVDALYDRFGSEYQQAVFEALTLVLREGPRAEVRLAVTAQRLVGPLGSLTALFGATLMLRMPTRQEHVLAGGDPARFESDLPPGGGTWKGNRVQLATIDPAPAIPAQTRSLEPVPGTGRANRSRPAAANAPDVEFRDGVSYLIVSGNPAGRLTALGRLLVGRGGIVDLTAPGPLGVPGGASDPFTIGADIGPTVVIGDPDAWQANWSILAALRSRSVLVFDGCTLPEVRAITHRHEVPPPLAPARNRVWLLAPDDTFRRATLTLG